MSTCEIPNLNGIIIQPFSFTVNLISCFMIYHFNQQLTLKSTKFSMFCIFLFELWHTFSHFIYFSNHLQNNVIYLLSYFINLSYYFVFLTIFKKLMSFKIHLLLFVFIMFDIFAFQNLSFIYYFISSLLIFMTILYGNFKFLKIYVKKDIIQLYKLIIILIILFFNEFLWCNKMQSIYQFPYHMINEILGTFIFYKMGNLFLKLEKIIIYH